MLSKKYKGVFFFYILFISFISQSIYSQTDYYKIGYNNNIEKFTEAEVRQLEKDKNLSATEVKDFFQFLRQDFSSKKTIEKQKHKHISYEPVSDEFHETVIYLKPNQPLSIGCPNMGFEQYNFIGWTGATGTVSTGGSLPNFNLTGSAIVNTAGNNVSVLNTLNYHTIMSLPPVNPVGPSVNGYDSLATRNIGGQNVSQIPVVSPFSFDPVSVRMNGAVANYRGSRLKYITTTSSLNQRLSFSYAVVFQDPIGQTAGQSPYFKVEVRNEGTGTVLSGCASYTLSPKTAVSSDSLFTASQQYAGESIVYRKWQYYSVDLSSLPIGSNVSINFEVGGSSLGNHWGYAYVDAECGGIGTPYASMCSGSNFATLTAPSGFISYQWRDPLNNIIPGATSPNYTVSPATPGTVYSVQMISPSGCIVTQTVQIQLTTVSIVNINSTSSCAGGNSGTALVQAVGSNGAYTYTWTRTSSPGAGTIVGNSQTVTGLASGNYSVLISSPSCGQASANLSVGTSPPFFSSINKQFCGNATYIAQSGGTNYKWYKSGSLIPAPLGTNDTMFISSAATGDVYTVVYNNNQGCKDSIRYNLSQIPGGNSSLGLITNTCPGYLNGSAVINLSPASAGSYTYQVLNSNYNAVFNTISGATTVTVPSLGEDSYTAYINDGLCYYSNTFSINSIKTNFTVTATNTLVCFPSDTAIFNLNFETASNYTINISSNGNIANNNSNTTIKVTPTFSTPPTDHSTTIYTITALNPIGNCIGTQTVEVLYPSLSNSILASPIDTTICEGETVQLRSSGGWYTNWYYIQNGNQVQIASTDTVNFSPSVTGLNQFVVYGLSPCPNILPDTKTITVNVTPKANLYISPLVDVTKCLNSNYVINTSVNSLTPGNNAQPFSYNWFTLPLTNPAPGINNASSYTVGSTPINSLVVSVNGNCSYPTSDTVAILNLTNDLLIFILDSSSTCPNLPFTLNSKTSGGYEPYTYTWFMEPEKDVLSSFTSLSTNSPADQGEYTYRVYVNDSCGYIASASQVITVLPPCNVEIPNIITPNGDSANEIFIIKNLEYHPNTSLTIYDRWGNKVFEASDYKNDWKANGILDGTYFYVIEVPDDKNYTGFITVLRQK